MILPPTKKAICLSVLLGLQPLDFWPGRRKPTTTETASEVDRLLANEVFNANTNWLRELMTRLTLRRVWLDIVGDIPSPENVSAFVLDPAKDKRDRIVDKLLANPQYGQNWARYWRDVFSRGSSKIGHRSWRTRWSLR